MELSVQCLEWQETRPGRWERGIDEAEQFYTSLAKNYEGTGRMFFAITGHVSLSLIVPDGISMSECHDRMDSALRKAWLSLRFEQPSIASWTEHSPRKNGLIKVYTCLPAVHDSEHEKDWLDETFKIVAIASDGQHWCNSDPPAPKLPTLFVLQTATSKPELDLGTVSRELVIRSPHDIMDGIGTLHLINSLLNKTSTIFEDELQYPKPVFGDEWRRLNPPLRTALGLKSALDQGLISEFDKIVAHNTRLRDDIDILSIPFQHGQLTPGRHQRVEINLSSSQTSQLLSGCKSIGVSVTHAYHAAAAVSLTRLQARHSSQRVVRYINYGLVNLRDKCQTPYCTPDYAAAVYHTVSPTSLAVDMIIPAASDPNKDSNEELGHIDEFKRVLGVVKTFYLSTRDNPELPHLSPLIWKASHLPYPVGAEKIQAIPLPNKTPSVSISSMGIIDKIIKPRHGQIEVHDPWVTGEELGNGLGLFLGTFKGYLSLSAAYNEAWHDKQDILDFLRQCHAVVSQGLGIESS